jgi:hypothetical protein
MSAIVYRSHLRGAWIVQTDTQASFRIDWRNVDAARRAFGARLTTVEPDVIAVDESWIGDEGVIPLVTTTLSGPGDDGIALGLSDESWLSISPALFRAICDLDPTD